MLLIAITVAASVLMYAYVSGLMGRLQGAAVQLPYVDRLALDYFDWTTLSSLKLYLRNVGASTINLVSADFFVNGQKITTTVFTCPTGVTPTALAPNSSCRATLTVPTFGINTGWAYNGRIVTVRGAVISYSCVAGQNTAGY
jgi:hypothetical protein